MRACVPLLALIGATGCENAISLQIDAPPEDLAVLAIVPATGEPRVLELRDREAPELELEDGDRAYVWILAHADLRNLDGTTLAREATQAADVRLDDEPRSQGKGACELCVLPADSPPQRVSPGDSCPLPPFARVLDALDGGKELEPEPLDPLRKRILVDWPGDCP